MLSVIYEKTEIEAFLKKKDASNKYGEIFYVHEHGEHFRTLQGKQGACVVPVMQIVDVRNPKKEVVACERIY